MFSCFSLLFGVREACTSGVWFMALDLNVLELRVASLGVALAGGGVCAIIVVWYSLSLN